MKNDVARIFRHLSAAAADLGGSATMISPSRIWDILLTDGRRPDLAISVVMPEKLLAVVAYWQDTRDLSMGLYRTSDWETADGDTRLAVDRLTVANLTPMVFRQWVEIEAGS